MPIADLNKATGIRYQGKTISAVYVQGRKLWPLPPKPYTFSNANALLAAIKDAYDNTRNANPMPEIHIKQGQDIQFPALKFNSNGPVATACWVTKDAPRDGDAPYVHALGEYDRESVLRGYQRCWDNEHPALWKPTGLGPGDYYVCVGYEFDSAPNSLSGGFLKVVIDP